MSTSRSASEIAQILRHLGDPGSDPDPQAFDELLADDIRWQLMGSGLEYARTYSGKAELYGEYMGKLQARLDHSRSRTSTVEVMADDGQGMVTVHNSDDLVLADGKALKVEVALLMKVTDGKVTEVREFMDLRPVEAAFGASLA
ncbi:nuclear transport factor 2 family protein [Sphaerisporangium sp. NPDC051011]|uniref:nuclear transport factor 2 family protein n=1 Tax=Sphaerisporangium sp. NPDC051011 TaxID=3155792 RepID=UPI0033D33081